MFQIKIVNDSSLAGVFIDWIDFDDWNDTCRCGSFPALKVIASETYGLPNADTFVNCKTFGQHK